MLLQCDITIVIGCRNIKQGEALLGIFRKEGITKGKIDVMKLDISVMDSVKEFAKAVREKYPLIHYLINNAGIMFGPYVETRDGYESQFSTNYLGHFLLTHLLLPRIKDAGKEDDMARIVNVSSCAHMVAAEINFADINNRSEYITGWAYAQSKLAQVLFTNYLEDLLRREGAFVQVHAVHPGIVNTELFDGSYLKNMAPWLPAYFFKSPERGAVPIVYACLSSQLEGKGGTYITNCEVYPPSEIAKSTELQKKLFDFTKDILKIEDFGKK
ncbi:unnamed protein product [Phaedon cochleariae]|uniref:Uncharacterized protein n=1 Tax=Phaedon cochleariae TaxID=80249 RepID=A0A9P0DKV4_PHACE|nr:unnamed protein product [Phaedon cochleariae]CAH1160179.1 unnamed protein product [Phaedon cochleariae]